MNILMVGPGEYTSTDGVIVAGSKYILKKSFPSCNIDYIQSHDEREHDFTHFNFFKKYDLVVVTGTPWLWDRFYKTRKFKNLMTCLSTHSNARKLFLGIGSCMNMSVMYNSKILERPDEVEAMNHMIGEDALVIVRGSLAKDKLRKAGISSHHLPCPAYFCYGDEPPSTVKTKDVLVYQDPRLSLSREDWTSEAKLNEYFNKMREYREYDTYCAIPEEVESAVENGFKEPTVLKDVHHTLSVMREARNVFSGRIHCAVPALAQGANVEIAPIDSRHLVITEFKDVKDFKPYLAQYIELLQKLGT